MNCKYCYRPVEFDNSIKNYVHADTQGLTCDNRIKNVNATEMTFAEPIRVPQ